MDQNRFEEMVMSALDKLREEIATTKSELAADISNIKSDISNIKSELAADISNIKSDIAWMKGKLEGRVETRHVVLTSVSIFIAICAVVVAIFK